ncbi:MAG: TonB-dependent receptor [Gammaproteobacteria bacterium]|nr:MAG: TonB-dependent receptor [Gammaproteobacteria bacterium]
MSLLEINSSDKKVRQFNLPKKLPFNLTLLATLVAGLSVIPSSFAQAVAESETPQKVIETQPPAAGDANFETPDEILIRVERQKTLKAVHDEPSSISIVTGSDLSAEIATDYQAITKRLANITFNHSNTRGASLSVRGIGKRGFAEVQDPSVLVNLDGVSFGLTALGNFDFFDIETVEGQRGATGTKGGKGGSAGEVNFNTKRPSFTPGTEFSVTYGQRNTQILQVATGGPVVDDLLAWRGALIINKADGYYQNGYGYDDNKSFYNRDRVASRIQLLLTPSDGFSARLSYDRQPRASQLENGISFRHDNQPAEFADVPSSLLNNLTDPNGTGAKAKLVGFYGPATAFNADGSRPAGTWTGPREWFTGRSSPETPGRTFTYQDYLVDDKSGIVVSNEYQGQYLGTGGTSLELIWNFENFDITSLTAERDLYFDAHNDDATSFDINKQGGGGVDYEQYSQEFKIVSKPGEVIDYVAGLYFIKTEDTVSSKTGYGTDYGAWNASTAQYNTLYRNAGVNRGAGIALLKESLADGYKDGRILVDTKSAAIYGSLDWHETEAATLTAGLRVGSEDRVTTDVIRWKNDGAEQGLNPVFVNPLAPVYLNGGFNSVAASTTVTGGTVIAAGTLGRIETTVSNGVKTTAFINDNNAAQLSVADRIANKYYGAAVTATPGAAYNSLTAAQKNQIAAAKAIRLTGIGFLTDPVDSKYDDTLTTVNLSQSYKFNDEITVYGTLQHSEKSGTGFNINGISTPVGKETTEGIELGLKTFLFDNTLTFNIDVYRLNISDYQQAIRVLDEYTTAVNNDGTLVYTTAQGNLDSVVAKGIEFDGTYTGIEHFTFRFGGAYNKATYDKYPNAPIPNELAYLTRAPYNEAYIDRSGEELPGAPKITFNVGATYRQPFNFGELHSSINVGYVGKQNNGDDFSTYTEQEGYYLVDASLGLASLNSKFDLTLVGKNLFDAAPHEDGWNSYAPYIYRRWIGIEFSSKF